MSWCRSVWVHLVWNPLCFIWISVFFFRFGKFSVIISWYEMGLLSVQWLSPLCQGQGLIPTCQNRSSSCQAQAASLPFKCLCFSLSAPGPLPPSRGCWSRWGLFTDQRFSTLPRQVSVAPLDATHGRVFSLVMAIPHPVPCCGMDWVGIEHLLGFGWGTQWSSSRKLRNQPDLSSEAWQDPSQQITVPSLHFAPQGRRSLCGFSAFVWQGILRCGTVAAHRNMSCFWALL